MEKNIMVQILVAENYSLLHIQLWIDPAEEFVQVLIAATQRDVTFAVKELKAYFDGPQNSAFDEGASSNFDATLVLATMLISQLHEGNTGPSANEMLGQADTGELLENSQRGIEQVLPRFHLIIPEYGLNSREVLQEVAVVLMEGKFPKKGS
ncbi:hypothetical protein NL676_020134 [Syzygium grande]|nr:hypothetical protein NL676_020134 [Syzygium grande]